LSRNKGDYLEFINFGKLDSILSINRHKKLVIEGVLLQKVLQKLDTHADYTIYIANSIWARDWFTGDEGKYCNMQLDEIVKQIENEITRVKQLVELNATPYVLSGFEKKLVEYSFEYKPWDIANIVLRLDYEKYS